MQKANKIKFKARLIAVAVPRKIQIKQLLKENFVINKSLKINWKSFKLS